MGEIHANKSIEVQIPALIKQEPQIDPRGLNAEGWEHDKDVKSKAEEASDKISDKPKVALTFETLSSANNTCLKAQASCQELIEKLSGRKIALENLLDFNPYSPKPGTKEAAQARGGEQHAMQGLENLLDFLKSNPPVKQDASGKAENIDQLLSELTKPVNSLAEIGATSVAPKTANGCERGFWERQIDELSHSTHITRLSLDDISEKRKDKTINQADLVYLAQRLYQDLKVTQENIAAFDQAKNADWQTMQVRLNENPALMLEQETKALNQALSTVSLNLRLSASDNVNRSSLLAPVAGALANTLMPGLGTAVTAANSLMPKHQSRADRKLAKEITAISDSLKGIQDHALVIDTMDQLIPHSAPLSVRKASGDLASRLDEYMPRINEAEKLLENPTGPNFERATEMLRSLPDSMGESYLKQ